MKRLPQFRYIPEGATLVDAQGTDAAVYTYEANGKLENEFCQTAGTANLYAIGYHGKASKPDFHYRYRDEAARAKAVADFIAGRKARAEAKASAPKTQTQAAIAAAEIRARLKAAGITASVRSDNFANGNSVDISLTDAIPATVAKAHKICDPFQDGHFDGMTDCYEYSNKNSDLPAQAKFVQLQTHVSPELNERIYQFVRSHFGEAKDFPPTLKEAETANCRIGDSWVSAFLWRQYSQADSAFWESGGSRK